MRERLLTLLITIMSCACYGNAQDSFFNPYDFGYAIEFSTELPADTMSTQQVGMMKVRYDSRLNAPYCTLTYGDSVRYEGRVIDMQLYRDRQEFMLENFFDGKHHAKMQIAVSPEQPSQKVALLYYAEPKYDPLPDKTCICMLLADTDNVPVEGVKQ